MIVGERAVQLYCFEGAEVKTIISEVKKLIPADSVFSEKYPLPLTSGGLGSANDSPTFVEIRVNSDDEVMLVFCSKRSYQERDKYSPTQLNEAVRKAFGSFDELIAIRHTVYQAFDVVVFNPKKERIELRIDQPKLLIADEIARVMARLIVEVQALVPGAAHLLQPTTAQNLFPAISEMYLSSKEGKVIDLGFQTHTGSIKHEKMRHSDADLRSEVFHAAGKAAIKTITPFSITLSWDDVRLTLPGHFRNLSEPAPYLGYARISSCTTASKFSALINKLVSYL